MNGSNMLEISLDDFLDDGIIKEATVDFTKKKSQNLPL